MVAFRTIIQHNAFVCSHPRTSITPCPLFFARHPLLPVSDIVFFSLIVFSSQTFNSITGAKQSFCDSSTYSQPTLDDSCVNSEITARHIHHYLSQFIGLLQTFSKTFANHHFTHFSWKCMTLVEWRFVRYQFPMKVSSIVLLGYSNPLVVWFDFWTFTTPFLYFNGKIIKTNMLFCLYVLNRTSLRI